MHESIEVVVKTRARFIESVSTIIRNRILSVHSKIKKNIFSFGHRNKHASVSRSVGESVGRSVGRSVVIVIVFASTVCSYLNAAIHISVVNECVHVPIGGLGHQKKKHSTRTLPHVKLIDIYNRLINRSRHW